MSAINPSRRSARAVPGPIAAIVALASALPSRPRSAIASTSSSAPFGLVRQTSA